MSLRLGTYIKLASVAVFDFALGTGIAMTGDYLFPSPGPDDSLLSLFGYSVAQLVFIVIASFELRGLMLGEMEDFQDPSGGLLFMVAIREMPVFWERIGYLVAKIKDDLFRPQKSPQQSPTPAQTPAASVATAPSLPPPGPHNQIISQIQAGLEKRHNTNAASNIGPNPS